MNVLNIHKRTIHQPLEAVAELLKTLATKNDKVWPKHYWPAMRFKEGLKVGSLGGHGSIRYTVEVYTETSVTFKFFKPKGFLGHHEFELAKINATQTRVRHRIDKLTKGIDTLKWFFVIRWLHDALIEDAFDTIENYFSRGRKRSQWTLWVRFWRFIFKMIR